MPDYSITDSVLVRIDSSDLRDLISDIDEVIEAIPEFFASIEPQIRGGLTYIMRDAFYAAVANAGYFPSAYQAHLLQGLNLVYPDIDVDGDSLTFITPDFEVLGSWDDLYEAGHNQAIAALSDAKAFSVSSPARVNVGAGEGDLYERTGPGAGTDYEKRLEFFQAMIDGEESFQVQLHGHTITVSVPDKEDTFRARVVYWGASYPEWLLLEFGDPEIGINPGGLQEIYASMADGYILGYMEILADKIVDLLERGKRFSFQENTAGEILRYRNRTPAIASRNITTGQFAQYLD